MKKVCLVVACGILMAGLLTLTDSTRVRAFPQFHKAFEAKYIGDKGSTPQKSLDEAVTGLSSKCDICHDPRKDENGTASKKNRNPYGNELDKLLTKDDKMDTDKIIKALEQVAGMKAEGSDVTFGEKLSKGELPFVYDE